MKRSFVPMLAIGLSIGVSLAHAQGMGGMEMKGMEKKDMQGMQMKGERKAGEIHNGSGTVTKLDAQKGTVTINHGPVKSMNWPAMTMTFKVKDKAALGKVKQGDKVQFSFVQSGKDYTITELK